MKYFSVGFFYKGFQLIDWLSKVLKYNLEFVDTLI